MLYSSAIFAQSKISFEKLNLEKGDIQSIVYGVCYDQYNNAWFATEEGLVRYNSRDVYLYNTNNGIPKNLGNRIFSVYKTSDNNLWIGSEKGVAFYNPEKNAFAEVKTYKTKISKTNQIIEDNFHNIWLAANNGLWKCSKDSSGFNIAYIVKDLFVYSVCANNDDVIMATRKGIFTFRANEKKFTPKSFKLISNITDGAIIKKINNQIIIGTQSGRLLVYNPDLTKYSEKKFSPKQAGVAIRDIEYKNGHYYLAIDGEGLMILNSDFGLVQHYYNDEDQPESISSNGLYDIYFGKDGIDWFTTYGGGVNYSISYKNQFTVIKHEFNNANSLSNNLTRAILEVNNTIWFGTKKGISIYDKTTKNWKHLTDFPNKNNNTEQVILTLTKDGDYVWAGSYYHGLYRISVNSLKIENFNSLYPDKKLKISKIFKVFVDKDKNIWTGGIENKLSVITKDKVIELPVTDIMDITQSEFGDIYAVGKDGVYIINFQNFTIKNIPELRSNKSTFEYNNINNTIIDKNRLFLGTNGAGLIIYDLLSKKVQNVTVQENLPSNIVQGIIKYSENNFWVSTTKGISNISLQGNKVITKNYSKADGLSSNEFNYGSYAKLSNGNIVFGGIDGVSIFNPSLLKSRNIFPRLLFEEFFINNELVKENSNILAKHVNQTDEIKLKYSQNSIGIKFVGILLGFSNKVKYIYKLEGFDEKWSEPSTKNIVNYTNLNSGEYTFRVKASDELGNFGPEKSLKILIFKPWYAGFWAILFYLIIFLVSIYALIEFIKILELKKNKEEQINFFNNITHEIKTPLAILLSTLEDKGNDENKRVKTNIERIDKLISQMLNFQRFSSMDASQMQISKIRLGTFLDELVKDFKPLLDQKSLKVEIHNHFKKEIFYYDQDFLNKILFNLLSNAIKYSHENNRIIITLAEEGIDKLLIKIKDFGIGIPKTSQKNILTKFFRAKNAMNMQFSGTGLGLMIVKNIVEKSKGKISFESKENVGSVFRVVIPCYENMYLETNLEGNPEKENYLQDLEKYRDKKILVVEDNADLRNYLVKKLDHYFLVYGAKNGKEGLEMAKNIFPDLIITDYMMPEMDGWEFCIKIKEDINLNHIPIFMLTALQDTVHKNESIGIGISEYIEKPIKSSFLLAKIVNNFSWQENLKKHYIHLNESDIAEKNKNIKENEFLVKLETIILDKIKDKDNDFTLLDICDKIGMSRTSLYMKLKNLVDLSPQDFIIHVRLKYAKSLLLGGDLNIKEVAYAAGFSNPKYFSTSFKKSFGMSPSDYVKGLSK